MRWLTPSGVSIRPQLEDLSLLLTRLQRHQSKLASVRNFAVGQLLHHYLTFPACQVSAGGPSWAQAGMACRLCLPCRALVRPAGWLSPLPVCFWVLQPVTVGSGGVPPLWRRGGAAWGGTDLNLASWAVQSDWQAGAWLSCLRPVPCQPCYSLKTHVGWPGGECRAPPLAEQPSSLVPFSLVGTCIG